MNTAAGCLEEGARALPPTLPRLSGHVLSSNHALFTTSTPITTQQIDTVVAACTHKDCVRALFSATLPEAVEGLARSVLKDPLRVTVGERNTGERSRGVPVGACLNVC